MVWVGSLQEIKVQKTLIWKETLLDKFNKQVLWHLDFAHSKKIIAFHRQTYPIDYIAIPDSSDLNEMFERRFWTKFVSANNFEASFFCTQKKQALNKNVFVVLREMSTA